MAAKKKVIATVAAVATSAALLLGGTMAWQSANQVALNEASDVINPGGRLHDDFNGENKDVYVENFADDPIYARVRLEEYFEITMNKGTAAEKAEQILGSKVTNEETGEEEIIYDLHVFQASQDERAGIDPKLTDANGEKLAWWTWTLGGETQYLPTFNLNKDSLAADVNGTYEGPDGIVTDNESDDRYTDYTDYNAYAVGDIISGDEIYDYDTNTSDEVKTDFDNIQEYVASGNVHVESSVGHAIAQTGSAELISMADWLQKLGENGGEYDESLGNYWVYDEDGWVYWSAPIAPHTATGLLLDGIKLNQVMDDTWYYAINVVAQFITADDMGKTDGTGFYDTTKGEEPSSDALSLLKAIGVEVPITKQAELQDAFEQGDTITLPDVTIASTEAEATDPHNLGFTSHYTWSEGGTLNGGTIETTGGEKGVFINAEKNWPVNGDDAAEAIVNDTTFISTGSDAAIYTQAIDGPITLNNVTVTSDRVGIWHDLPGNTLTLNGSTVTSNNTYSADKPWLNSAVAAVGGGDIVINGGTFNGNYAAYVFSSGGSITINDGTFNGDIQSDNGGTITINGGTFNGDLGTGGTGKIVIKGGTFDHDPSDFVADGYEAVENGDGTWTVQADTSDKTAPTVSTVVGNGLIYTYTITNVSDTDFPMTMHVYWADNDNVYSESVSALYTVNYALDEDGTVVQTGNGTEAHDANITYENGTITSVLNTVVEEDGYWGVTISDNAGNIGRLEQPINVTKVIGCFAAGTQVLTKDGLKNIEDITLGELVWSVNMETYRSELKPVTYVQGERYTPATYTIHVGGEKIVTTYEHPFYANGKWTAAEDLKAGDMLRRMDGTEVAIDKVVYTELAEPLRVYNFTVDENHCYIVSAQELLVHNIQK